LFCLKRALRCVAISPFNCMFSPHPSFIPPGPTS
jgi:hypothetical protein